MLIKIDLSEANCVALNLFRVFFVTVGFFAPYVNKRMMHLSNTSLFMLIRIYVLNKYFNIITAANTKSVLLKNSHA